MKRHPSLAPLSREHHGALILARLLREGAPEYKGLPADTGGKARYALKFYRDYLVKHFEQEEMVLELVTGRNNALDALVQIIFLEHKKLHILFHSINNHPALQAHLDDLGRTLEIHIRKEERELFPLIEETCSDELMEAIKKSLFPNN